MEKALIILNGNTGNELDTFNYNEYDVYCIDGGTKAAYRKSIKPVCIIGDLDSSENEIIDYFSSKKVKIISFPSEKNESDFELGLKIISDNGYKEIVVIGGNGGRIDHTLLNIFLAAKYIKKGLNISFITQNEKIEFITGKKEIMNCKGKTVSLISTEDCEGVTLGGFKYPLKNGNVCFGSTLGLSNIIEEEIATVEIKKGFLIVITNDTII